MAVTRHELKTWPQFFAAVRSGAKRFEIRLNDRGFMLHDILVLREWDPAIEDYTGQVEERQITFLLTEADFGSIVHGYVAIGFGAAPHVFDGSTLGDQAQSLTLAGLMAWHQARGLDALQRAEEARKVAVSSPRFAPVAVAADGEADFHARACALLDPFGWRSPEPGCAA